MDFDIIVIGSGIAGLSAALKCARMGHSVAVVTKKNCSDTNTNHAQGGIASVTSSSDDFALHVSDTMIAGDGLCKKDVVENIVRNGPKQIEELIKIGVDFTNLENGNISLGKEGGHSKRRILHVKDFTGQAIESALVKAVEAQKNIRVFEHHYAIDFITDKKLGGTEKRVVGLYVFDKLSEKILSFKTNAIVLASGGVGCVYLYTTNPDIATADGIAMAYRAGAKVSNLEFIQFHPTALYSTTSQRFLISEAVRGEGAILRNMNGVAFMKSYDKRADLAPRDIVARAIDSEMKKLGSAHVWLDITKLSRQTLQDRFPLIYNHCIENGIDISKDYIPVVPAAHYICGGVVTNIDSSTNVEGLYACGEVACTGLHGANRLASNSLLEALVLSNNASLAIDAYLKTCPKEKSDIPEWIDDNTKLPDERVILLHNQEELKRTMWDYVCIVRTDKRLQWAMKRISNLEKEINDYYWNFKIEPNLLETRNMILVSKLIVCCAIMRKESRGLHYTTDYPNKLPNPQDTLLQLEENFENIK